MKVTFECVDKEGQLVQMVLETANHDTTVLAEIARAYQRCGYEVMRVSRMETMEVDLDVVPAPWHAHVPVTDRGFQDRISHVVSSTWLPAAQGAMPCVCDAEAH